MFLRLFRLVAVIAIVCSSIERPATAQPGSGSNLTFKRTVLDTVFRSEGVAVGDFDHDGKKDIAAGAVWYSAPDWKMQLTGEKAPEYDPLNYSHAFQTFADDLNGDGWVDVIVVDWPGAMTYWLENPQGKASIWKLLRNKHFLVMALVVLAIRWGNLIALAR